MKIIFGFLLLFVVDVHSELRDYEDIRPFIEHGYLEQFDLIVDDTSVCEEETNRKLVVLGSHFNQQNTIRTTLIANARSMDILYEKFLSVSQVIFTAKHMAQEILSARNTTNSTTQYNNAVQLDRLYPMEMSALLDICAILGYETTDDVIYTTFHDIPAIRKLAADLEEYVLEVREHGYAIAQALHGEKFVSRRYRTDSRQTFLKKFPKAMRIHDHVIKVMTDQEKMRSITEKSSE